MLRTWLQGPVASSSSPLSLDEIKAALRRHEDFTLTDIEVRRRDSFYQEHLEGLRDIRLRKKRQVDAVIQYESNEAKKAVLAVFGARMPVRYIYIYISRTMEDDI